MKLKDLKPSRLACTFELLKPFIENFYDKNPLSHLGFGVMKETKMSQLSDLAQYSREHHTKLQQLKESDSNEISLKNSLEIAMELLKQTPLYASKEILIILSANSSSDPGDINETIEELKRLKIKVSIIALSCKMYVCKRITENTHGTLDLATNKERFRDLLIKYANPSVLNLDAIQVTLVPIGFPAKRTEEIKVMKNPNKPETLFVKTLCSCHDSKMDAHHYICPRCKGRNCDIPAKCGICNLNLISASLLARSDPVPKFSLVRVFLNDEMRENGLYDYETMHIQELLGIQNKCSSCSEPFESSLKTVKHASVCPSCKSFFCLKCDVYIHDSLFNCPECI
jgi:transcription initiation factor TFIIH subunit 2